MNSLLSRNLSTTESQAQSPFTGTPQKECHFFKLPRELRDRIYELVVPNGKHIIVEKPYCTVIDRDERIFDRREERFEWNEVAPLLLTCKQTRSETVQMFYGTNEFVLSDEHPVHWLRARMLDSRKHLRILHIEMHKLLRELDLHRTRNGLKRLSPTERGATERRVLRKVESEVKRLEFREDLELEEMTYFEFMELLGIM
jgi:hypothetical protein